MTTPRSTEERISQWLEEEAVGQLSDRVLEASFETTRGVRQVRASAWRHFSMSRPIPAMVAVGAAAIIVLAGVIYFRPAPSGNVGGSSPSPTLSATPAPSPTPTSDVANLLDTATWTTYVSDRYGFAIGHPVDWTEVPSTREWSVETDAKDWLSPAADAFFTPEGQGVRVSAWSVPNSGDRLVAWIETYCAELYEPCSGVTDGGHPASMDAHDGLLFRFTHDTQAFFQVDGRIYAVAVWWPDSDPAVQRYGGSQRLLEAFISTMRLLPGGPTPGSTSPSPS